MNCWCAHTCGYLQFISQPKEETLSPQNPKPSRYFGDLTHPSPSFESSMTFPTRLWSSWSFAQTEGITTSLGKVKLPKAQLLIPKPFSTSLHKLSEIPRSGWKLLWWQIGEAEEPRAICLLFPLLGHPQGNANTSSPAEMNPILYVPPGKGLWQK